MLRASEPAPAARSWDPVVLVVAVASFVVFLLHGFDGGLTRDAAIYSYGGQQVVEGVPPYVSILNRAGPLSHLVPALGVAIARVVGIDDVLGIRILFMVISVACVCLVYLVARDIFRSRTTGLVAASAFITFQGFIEYATYGPREKTLLVLFLLVTLLACTRRSWLTAGVGVALATLVWQPAFLVGTSVVVVTVLSLPRKERTSALLRVVGGGAIPAVAVVVYFVIEGAFDEFVDAFLLINARYTTPDPLLSDLGEKWSGMLDAYGLSLIVLLVGFGGLVVAAVTGGRNGRSEILRASAVGALVALLWSLRDFNDWPDAFVVFPFAAVGIGALATRLSFQREARLRIAAVVVSLVAIGVALTYSIGQRNDLLSSQRASVSELEGGWPNDYELLSVEAPEVLVLARRTNPTRHQMFLRGLDRYVDDTHPGGMAGFVRWIENEAPDVLATGEEEPPSWLASLVEDEFVRLDGGGPGWTWYVRRKQP
jgi:hypothetical protein